MFSAEGSVKRWHKIDKGARVEVDPLAGLTLDVGLLGERKARPGESTQLQPRLTTADGLLINTCWRGKHTGGSSFFGPGAEIALLDPKGQELATTHSGFA